MLQNSKLWRSKHKVGSWEDHHLARALLCALEVLAPATVRFEGGTPAEEMDLASLSLPTMAHLVAQSLKELGVPMGCTEQDLASGNMEEKVLVLPVGILFEKFCVSNDKRLQREAPEVQWALHPMPSLPRPL